MKIENITKECINWIKSLNIKGAVVGISGGKDSAVVAKLCSEALGKENVFGVLMPDGKQSDFSDAECVVKHLEIAHTCVNIREAKLGLINNIGIINYNSSINIAPRLRMTVLYSIAQTLGYRVAGTGNNSESILGYCTKWGDIACDFNPIANFFKEEVVEIGNLLNLPSHIMKKEPSDGLTGQTDEEKLGISYRNVYDSVLAPSTVPLKIRAKIQDRYENSRHKFRPVPTFKFNR